MHVDKVYQCMHKYYNLCHHFCSRLYSVYVWKPLICLTLWCLTSTKQSERERKRERERDEERDLESHTEKEKEPVRFLNEFSMCKPVLYATILVCTYVVFNWMNAWLSVRVCEYIVCKWVCGWVFISVQFLYVCSPMSVFVLLFV